jgi:pyridoxine 5-phosphate synthase
MTRLSVNLNKVALLRNSRSLGIPSVLQAAERCVAAGAHGITVHPRPDQRHVKSSDVLELAELLRDHPGVEFNVEGNPFPEFVELVRRARPAQCTLVPDGPDAVTSDHGWNLREEATRLEPIVFELHDCGTRVSIFMDVESEQWARAREIGADRVELYTQPYAAAYARNDFEMVLDRFAAAASAAQSVGLGVNAGHDLNLKNLAPFCRIPGILEVSIGHALVSDALEVGLYTAVRQYLQVLGSRGADC